MQEFCRNCFIQSIALNLISNPNFNI